MFSLNDKISIRQFQILIILDIFGTGITLLPRKVAEFSGQDGWISVVIATLIMVIIAYMLVSLAGMFPDTTFVDYCSKILSKPIGIIISLGFVVKIVLRVAFELRFFGEIVRQYLLAKTPFFIVCMTMLLLGAYAASKGFETRARIGEIIIFIVFIPLILVLGLTVIDVDFSNLKPFFVADKMEIAKGSYSSLFAFNGLEFCLLSFPYLSKKADVGVVRKGVIQSVVLVGIFMTIITIITIAKFGIYDIQRQIWPVLEMMDAVSIPGSFFERQGALIMSFWIVSIFAIVNSGIFFSSLLLKDICKRGKHYMYVLLLIPVIFILSLIPGNVVLAYKYSDLLNNTFGILYFIVFPLLMLIIAKIRGVGGKTNEK